jgi:hypothetical protein
MRLLYQTLLLVLYGAAVIVGLHLVLGALVLSFVYSTLTWSL